jgi:[ribosomal protein S5]-alanine N-acetyltransferase
MSRVIVFDPNQGTGEKARVEEPGAPAPSIVGRIGFHGKPDERGMVEVGYEIDPAHWRKGHATAAMRIIVASSRAMDGVSVLRASVAEENAVSARIVKGCGLRRVGSRVHERWGAMNLYELNVQD